MDVPERRGMPVTRRGAIGLASAAVLAPAVARTQAAATLGLTPVFLDSDAALLADIERYLSATLDRSVQLVKKRTYQEITALLVAGQLDAAWICGFPYVQFRDRLSLLAVPVFRGRSLYQSYVIARAGSPASAFTDLRGTVHAFSDPDSNSGFLVTRHLLSTMRETPQRFFGQTFFTYSHRNVIRAVASGLAQGGSVDGYVWEVMRETDPELVAATRVIRRSEWLGFPPIACPAQTRGSETARALGDALTGMAGSEVGRGILAMLRLDGFQPGADGLFDGIAAKWHAVREQS